jgi:hypothetical protein
MLLGSKRPQHKAWNFVVLSLWAIVALPAAETFLLHPGRPVEMGGARGWFLWVLILLGPINFGLTRYWLASFSLAAGQIIALGPYLAVVHRRVVPQPEFLGLMLAMTALVAAWLTSLGSIGAANAFDRLWLDFRDTFGLFWGLRVQERLNAAAKQNGWEVELTWSGFHNRSADTSATIIDPVIGSNLHAAFKGLLRRFVSGHWIAQRLDFSESGETVANDVLG